MLALLAAIICSAVIMVFSFEEVKSGNQVTAFCFCCGAAWIEV
jgi:hypothetical protein